MTIAPDLLADLRVPSAYPHAPSAVDVVQTHISCVFLAGDQVFKVKKPVRFTFLDFSTLERRRHFCEEEVRLNRRLAAEVYLDVVPIVRTAKGHRVGGPGVPVEYAVHMRRLPNERLLRAVLERGEADRDLIGRIAAKMAAFHATADSGPEVAAAGTPEELRRTLDGNFASLMPHAALFAPMERSAAVDRHAAGRHMDTAVEGGTALEELRVLLETALARVNATLRARAAAGRVRDGHGDLRPDHICCTETLPIIDCVEFSARLRACDVASEMAFLASELDFHAVPELADALIDAYVRASGDAELPTVVPFFRTYRAQVRTMVAALTAAEPEVDAAPRARARDDARRYLALAVCRGWRAQGAFLVAIAGRSGTGKSTLARALGAHTGLAVVRSDLVRKRLAGLPPDARPTGTEEIARLYSPARSEAVYAALADEAARACVAGEAIILDATFQRVADRDRIRAVAVRTRTPLFWIECRAATPTVRQRLVERARRDDDPSDATPAVADEQARRFEPLTEGTEPRLVLTTDADDDPLATARGWLLERLRTAMDRTEGAW